MRSPSSLRWWRSPAQTPARPAAGKWKIGSRRRLRHRGKITVSGNQKLTTTTRGGYTNRLVGKSTPKTSSGVTPLKVKVHQAGQTMTGTLDIVFAVGGTKRDNDGDLTFGSCVLSFFANR